MEASELERKLRMLQISRYTLNSNYSQLQDAEKYHQKHTYEWVVKGSDKMMNEYILEYSRRFHNYLSSYYSLYSHTQRVRNHIDSGTFDERCDQKLDELNIKRTSSFVNRLRAYMQHYQIISINLHGNYNFETETESSELYIPREKLLEWDSWSGSEDYILELDEEIEIIPLLEDIHDSVNMFGDWFISELQSRSDVQNVMLDDYAGSIDVDEPYSLS